jgi:hypothetical protein
MRIVHDVGESGAGTDFFIGKRRIACVFWDGDGNSETEPALICGVAAGWPSCANWPRANRREDDDPRRTLLPAAQRALRAGKPGRENGPRAARLSRGSETGRRRGAS